ncbi:MAG TPA: hypothetical protein VFE91_04085, partial [Nitrososphaerales archaeon]|nr:hypothetical protein [Nitrososphaerales archaeon]
SISVPSGTALLFCGGLYWANPAQSTTDLPPGNLCTTLSGTSLGPATNTQTLCTVQTSNMCEFTGTALVAFGSTGGTFQVQFASASNDLMTVVADSMIFVGPGQ